MMYQYAPGPQRQHEFSADLRGFEDFCAGKIILCQLPVSGQRGDAVKICLVGIGKDVSGKSIFNTKSDCPLPITQAS